MSHRPAADSPAAAPAPRRRMARADRSAQLLATAEQVFAERGYRAASMEEIADRAGVTKPVLYDHFGSKDGLLAAVVAHSGAAISAATQAAVAGATRPDEALERGLLAYFTFIEQHATAWSVLLTEAEASTAAAGALEDIRREIGEFVAVLIADELPPGELARARLYAHAVVGAAERLALHARGAGPAADSAAPLDAPTLTTALLELLWLGMDTLRGGARWSAAGAVAR